MVAIGDTALLELLSSHPVITTSTLFSFLFVVFAWCLTLARLKAQTRLSLAKQSELEEAQEAHNRQAHMLQEQSARQFARIGNLEATEQLLKEQNQQLQQKLTEQLRLEREQQGQLNLLLREKDTLEERFNNQTHALKEKVQLLESSEQRLLQEFEALANRIFEQKSQAIRSSNESSLESLLKPFKEQISGFQQQVQQKSEADSIRHSMLNKELDDLRKLNLRMSEEALNLTKALKGENKVQGNWGEVVLQTLLDQAGLCEGREYETQVSLNNEKGKRYQPDVIVHLPQERDIIIDSKVTLTAYERYVNTSDEALKAQHLQAHVLSLKSHIKELSKKSYHELKGLKTLDYVLLFVPIESAFLVAVQEEPELIRLGLELNIMLVSPTNLMTALRTIHNIWQVEQQNQNAQQIADRAGKLYDKFAGFVEDLERVGSSIQRAGKEYEAAHNKLTSGTGNLMRQAKLLEALGVRGSKQLPETVAEEAEPAS